MINNKITDKLMLIAIIVALIGALLLQGAATGKSATANSFTKYAAELFSESIISVNIQVDQSKWDEMISDAQAKTYIMADVVVNGITYQDVGVRTKGNASLSQVSQSASPERYSLRIKFDEYIDGQTCLGLDELVLNNMISDPSYMKEYLSQDLMRFIGVEAPLTNYASISVNGEGIGFYVALESYGESYNLRVDGDTSSNFYNVKTMELGGGQQNAQQGDFAFGRQQNQANRQAPTTGDWQDRQGFVGKGGGSTGGSLEYTDDDPDSYSAIFENALQKVSTSEEEDVIEALKALNNGDDLESYFDVDQIIRYFAAHTVLVSMDSYYSSMAQNYVIQERDGIISILPWDYHLSYGGFQSGSASEIVNAPIDTPLSGVTLESRPLLNAILSNETYTNLYHQYLQQIVTDYFDSGLFEETVRTLQTKISAYVKSDPTAFTTFDEFNTAVDALLNLNLLRAQSITGQLDGTIPATTEGQTADSSALVDASSIQMSDLGSSGMGGGGATPAGDMGGGGGDSPERGMGDNQGNLMQEMPDQDVLRQAMEIVQAAGGELTDEVKEQLLALGITEEQLNLFENGQGGFPTGGNPSGQGMPQNGQDFSTQSTPQAGQNALDQSTPQAGQSFPGQNSPQDWQNKPDNDQQFSTTPEEQTNTSATRNIANVFSSYAIQTGVLGGLLALVIFLVAKFKRSY